MAIHLRLCHVLILPTKRLIPLLLKSPKAADAFLITTTSGSFQAGRLIGMGAEHVNDYEHDPLREILPSHIRLITLVCPSPKWVDQRRVHKLSKPLRWLA